MSVYAAEDEERIRAQAAVREWARSRLLDAAQGARLAADLHVELRRTNVFLRAALALFTAMLVAAVVGLILVAFEVRSEQAIAAVTVVAALGCYGLAERLAGPLRFYRFGVEEMLAVAALVLVCISDMVLMWSWKAGASSQTIVPLAIGALGGLGLFLRFGFLYGAAGALVCAAAIPFHVDAPAALQRALAAAVCAAAFAFARAKALQHRDDYLGDDYRLLQVAAWAGIYLVLNVQVTPGWSRVTGWFYWFTYAITWMLPPIGLLLGIRDKDRVLVDVSGALLLVTLVTSKLYLGWERHTWDPIVLGGVLMVTAIGVRRWLAAGPGGERGGFTPDRLLEKDGEMLSLLATAASVRPGHGAPAAAPAPSPSPFEGGRSGGGGGGDRF